MRTRSSLGPSRPKKTSLHVSPTITSSRSGLIFAGPTTSFSTARTSSRSGARMARSTAATPAKPRTPGAVMIRRRRRWCPSASGCGSICTSSSECAAGSRRFGIETITATGKSERQSEETGGVAGFRTLLRKLKSGKSVYVTGEIPPTPGRQVGRGTPALARLSGRPIVPVASASTRRAIFTKLWDEMQLPHPFGRFTVVMGEPLAVASADEEETAAQLLKQRLDAAYARALEATAS